MNGDELSDITLKLLSGAVGPNRSDFSKTLDISDLTPVKMKRKRGSPVKPKEIQADFAIPVKR